MQERSPTILNRLTAAAEMIHDVNVTDVDIDELMHLAHARSTINYELVGLDDRIVDACIRAAKVNSRPRPGPRKPIQPKQPVDPKQDPPPPPDPKPKDTHVALDDMGLDLGFEATVFERLAQLGDNVQDHQGALCRLLDLVEQMVDLLGPDAKVLADIDDHEADEFLSRMLGLEEATGFIDLLEIIAGMIEAKTLEVDAQGVAGTATRVARIAVENLRLLVDMARRTPRRG